MEKNLHELPPSKRFKLLNSRQPISQPSNQETNNPKFLPAKKRTNLLYNSSSFLLCLPAKKRVWALTPQEIEEAEELEKEEGKPNKETEETEHPINEKEEEEEKPNKETEETEHEIKEKEEQEEETDDGIFCAVCQSTDGEPADPIVFCDGCDLMVHASCYGNPLIKSIPDGDWFCLVCKTKDPKKKKKFKQDKEPQCCLCPVKGGALKPTVNDKWAHIMCALLVPEVFFRGSEGREGIDCSRIPSERFEKDCYICGFNCSGCVIDCAESKCKLGFHVSCGLEKGLCIEYREGRAGDIVAGFCGDHTLLWEKQQLTGKFRIVPREQELKGKSRA